VLRGKTGMARRHLSQLFVLCEKKSTAQEQTLGNFIAYFKSSPFLLVRNALSSHDTN